MSKINVDKNKIIPKKLNQNLLKLNQYKSPSKSENITQKLNVQNNSDINIPFPKKTNINYTEDNNNLTFSQILPEDKDNKLFKGFLQKLNKIGEFGFNEKTAYMLPISNKDSTDISENNNNIYENNIEENKSNKTLNNNVIDINKNIKTINLNINNMNNSFHQSSNISPNKQMNSLLFNDQYDSKYSFKINKIKDDYIDFLQKEFEDNTKKSAILDSNNKELMKKCDDLLHDNKLLSSTLNDRSNKLNKIIQENLTVKSQLDKALILNQKNEQKLQFFQEQFTLYKTSNENYQKIIQELKEQIDQLNNNISDLQKTHEENLNEAEINFNNNLKIEIEKNKKETEDFYENKNREEIINNEQKFEEMQLHIKNIEEKNDLLNSELNKKDNMYNILLKENEKLMGENTLFKNEIEQYTHQISELNNIIKHKDNIINNLKSENLNNEKLLNKSSSCSMIKLDGNEYINENISKLINDNEENKMKIEMLNDKIKNIDQIEKKYNEIINGNNRSLILSEKLAFHMNSTNTSPRNLKTQFNYNNYKESTYPKNYNIINSPNSSNNFRSFISPKKLQLQEISTSPRNKYDIPKTKTFTNSTNTIIISSNNMPSNNNNNTNLPSQRISNKEMKESFQKKIEISPPQILNKYYYNKNNVDTQIKIHGKEIKTEKDEIKDSIKTMERKKNFTHKPKNVGIYISNTEIPSKNEIQNISIIHTENEEEIINEQYFLYGIDRDDLLHVFDINSRKWSNLRKITELKDVSNTFKKDYQYEGTILYNTLSGLYILTGEKTDVLYFYNSLTDSVTKICKFNFCHDNGSLFFDSGNDALFVFGGKKIKSCEYYSFKDKKIYKLPELNLDRANASYIVSNNKIFAFFGFCYSKNTYCNNIEYIDYTKKDRWYELSNISLLKNDISFDIESVSTMYYRNDPNLILIYCGIQGDEEDFVTEYYLIYDSVKNTMDKINKFNLQQFKYLGKKWKNYTLKNSDQKGFHFAKNSRFLKLPKNNNYEGYNSNDEIEVLIDYKNNVHFIQQDKQKIDVYRNEL